MLHHTGFFPGYLGKSFSEVFAMIKADGGDYRKETLDDIGRIRSPPHTGFDNSQIDAAFCKAEESDGCHEFEECRLLGSSPEHSLRSIMQSSFNYLDIVYPESLGEP